MKISADDIGKHVEDIFLGPGVIIDFDKKNPYLNYPVVVEFPDQTVERYTREGYSDINHIRPALYENIDEGYLNIYGETEAWYHHTKESAEKYQGEDMKACAQALILT